jgi:hypothetical protein
MKPGNLKTGITKETTMTVLTRFTKCPICNHSLQELKELGDYSFSIHWARRHYRPKGKQPWNKLSWSTAQEISKELFNKWASANTSPIYCSNTSGAVRVTWNPLYEAWTAYKSGSYTPRLYQYPTQFPKRCKESSILYSGPSKEKAIAARKTWEEKNNKQYFESTPRISKIPERKISHQVAKKQIDLIIEQKQFVEKEKKLYFEEYYSLDGFQKHIEEVCNDIWGEYLVGEIK